MNQNASVLGGSAPDDVAQQGGLTGATASEQYEDFVGLNVKVYAVKYLMPVIVDADVREPKLQE